MRKYYVGMDVHQATTVIVVLNGKGKVVMETVVATKAESLRAFFKQLNGEVQVTFEEGTQAAWLHGLLRTLVARVLVCNPRRNKTIGNKTDRIDAQQLARWLWQGVLHPVYHGEQKLRRLKELAHNYSCLVRDCTRVMNRLKAIYRGRGISCAGSGIYRVEQRGQWLAKLREVGARERASFLFQELDFLRALKKAARQALLQEARRHSSYRLLKSLPQLGPLRVAQIIALVQTPFRFRNKRQFWTYAGFAVVVRMTSEYELNEQGRAQRRRRPVATRGLNRNHNHELKYVLKSAAQRACAEGPFHECYERLVARGLDPSLAQLTIARKLAAATLTVWKTGVPFAPERMKEQMT